MRLVSRYMLVVLSAWACSCARLVDQELECEGRACPVADECADTDGDGVPDCEDGCIDADRDGVCAVDDCDDDPTTGARCSTGCITANLDRDGDGYGSAQTRLACVLGAGLSVTSDDCADSPSADPGCGGLEGSRCSPGKSEICGDLADNDCNGAADCAEPACAGLPCDDGRFCTVTDACAGGVCTGTGDPCEPASDADCIACNEEADSCSALESAGSPCDDGVFCNGADTCDARGECTGHAGNPCSTTACSGSCSEAAQTCASVTPGNCFIGGACYADGALNPENPCQACSASVSQSVWTNRTGACNDGQPCTHSDTCGAGVCAGVAITCTNSAGTCGARRACNGTASCTVTYPGSETTCNDGRACTYNDRCNGSGQCSGTSIECSSDAGCGLQRACNGTSSCTQYYPNSATSCDDGQACTHSDGCNGAGGCSGIACGNLCGESCVYTPNPRPCAYGTPPFADVWCTGDATFTREGMTVTPSCACQVAGCSDPNNDVYMDPTCEAGQYSTYVCCNRIGTRDCGGSCY